MVGVAALFVVATTTALLLGRAAGDEPTIVNTRPTQSEAGDPGAERTIPEDAWNQARDGNSPELPAPATPTAATPDEGDVGAGSVEGQGGNEASRAADAAASEQVAVAFVTTWATPGIGRPPWLQRLQPLSSASMFELLTYTDLSRVPADAVVGARSRSVEYLEGVGAQGLVVVELASTSSVQVWTQKQADATWVVTGIEPTPATADPAGAASTSATKTTAQEGVS